MTAPDAWRRQAACRDGDPEAMFVTAAEDQHAVARVCRRCPVMAECAGDALDNRVEHGVWGGMTERERRALLRRYPNVTGWRDLFVAARDAAGGAA